MPIRVRYLGEAGQECTIRPTPLVSISTEILKTGAGQAFGVTYGITLTGTLLADQGMPYAYDHTVNSLYPFHGTPDPTPSLVGPYGVFDKNTSHTLSNRPSKQQVPVNQAATAILQKQKALRALFKNDGQRLEITDIDYDNAAVICYPRLVGIDFEEGTYIDKCGFTIQLEADTLLNSSLSVDSEGMLNSLIDPSYITPLSSLDESWTLELDESAGESIHLPFSFRISHSVSATGKAHYFPDPDNNLLPWVHARNYVQSRLTGLNDYPNFMNADGDRGDVPGSLISYGTLNLLGYNGYNHVRSEEINEVGGSYSVNETWLLAKGNVLETFSTSTAKSTTEKFVNASCEGKIKGLSHIELNQYGIPLTVSYDNALVKYNGITSYGSFGLTSDVFARMNSTATQQLNSQPLTVTVGHNVQQGEITYNMTWNDRPEGSDSAGISGVCNEDITISDTYPGDVFATIPVLGRQTGPVLQYVGSRTAYTRNVSISLDMCQEASGALDVAASGLDRETLILKKPSITQPSATQIANLIEELSPAKEPGVRKYFVSPPQETWHPRAGSYTLDLTWTYEMDF